MKTFIHHPFTIYLAASLACLCIMIIVDYMLGSEAEHLNAWAILNKLLGKETAIEDSLAIRQFGLGGATLLMLIANTLFGFILIQLIKSFIQIVHA